MQPTAPGVNPETNTKDHAVLPEDQLEHKKPVPKTVVKVLLAVMGIGAVILASQAVYTLNNNPNYSGAYQLFLAKATSKNPKKSLSHLEKAAVKVTKVNSNESDDELPQFEGFSTIPSTTDQQFQQAYANYLTNTYKFGPTTPFQLSIVYYNLALIAYQGGQNQLAKDLFNAAVHLAPNIGHYHIELANLYLIEGNKEKSAAALEFCTQFITPYQLCNDYLDSIFYWNSPLPVGFTKNVIDGFY